MDLLEYLGFYGKGFYITWFFVFSKLSLFTGYTESLFLKYQLLAIFVKLIELSCIVQINGLNLITD